MAKDTEKETLLDLFSTRSRSSTTATNYIEGPSPSAVAVRNSSRDVTDSAATPRGTGSSGAGRAAPLSAVGNAILREARKELGNSEGFDDEQDISEESIATAIDKVCATRGYVVDDIVRADLIVHLKKDLLGWGILQPLIDNPEVTDVHCYDYQTVVLQRGKISETTGLHWPIHEAYCTF